MNDHAGSLPYRVLARKYRPQNFADLIGQEAMVRTLTNAIAAGRIAHAYILTGVRGVGKTTTARIIARALNCVGADGPTIAPCGVCANCTAIAADRHVDVIEMDAASRTGVDDIRELIEGVLYRPVSARYKVYIIDEVHMLSRAAFNALLKTLEEPPEHVKFVFATTEIRKVPVTVLSRCQRFDLRRVPAELLARHLVRIAGAEAVQIEEPAIRLIARAADGSVRDALSLLDQAIALAAAGGAIREPDVRGMLGLADGGRVFDLFEATMKGAICDALDIVAELYVAGADPVAVLQDLLELSHWLTRLKHVPEAADDPTVSETDRARGKAMAETLSVPVLARAWQMLLKGVTEAGGAPSAIQAAEMILVRLAYVAELPTPAELARLVQRPGGAGAAAGPPPRRGGPGTDGQRETRSESAAALRSSPPSSADGPRAGPAQLGLAHALPIEIAAPPAPSQPPAPEIASFIQLVALFERKREPVLHTHLVNDVHLVRFEPSRIEFRATPQAPAKLANRVSDLLRQWTGTPWFVTLSTEPGEPTLRAQAEHKAAAERAAVLDHPLVRAVLATFPGAEITQVQLRAQAQPQTPEIAIGPAPDEPPSHDAEPESGPDPYPFDDEDVT